MSGDDISVERAWEHLQDVYRAEASQAADYEGLDWYQITPEEQKVFGITLTSVPGVVTAYRLYEEILDLTDTGLLPPAVMAVIRRDLAERIGMEPGILSQSEFKAFAKFLGVSHRIAHAWYVKHEFWCVRRGITQFQDENDGGTILT